MATVFLGIGTNIGDRRQNIAAALRLLRDSGVTVVRSSTLIETDPVGGPAGQGRYLNGALQTTTELAPHDLLACLKRIEKEMGRAECVRNAPRIIDLDILLYDNLEMRTPDLTIPHPRMFERDFVMRPLRELKPDAMQNVSHAHH